MCNFITRLGLDQIPLFREIFIVTMVPYFILVLIFVSSVTLTGMVYANERGHHTYLQFTQNAVPASFVKDVFVRNLIQPEMLAISVEEPSAIDCSKQFMVLSNLTNPFFSRFLYFVSIYEDCEFRTIEYRLDTNSYYLIQHIVS